MKCEKIINKKEKNVLKNTYIYRRTTRIFNLRFNILYDSPPEITQRFLIKFGLKFPAFVKTFYKLIYLGLLGLLNKNLLNSGRRNITNKKPDNGGKLDERFRSIWDIKNKETDIGLFEMDTVIGKDHQYSCLVLVEQSNEKYFSMKLEEHTANEFLEQIEHIVIINVLVGKIKGIITDRGKLFSKFEEMEKIAGTNVYYYDPGSPKQKTLIERIKR